jgi:hypothetical protein
MRGGAQQVVYFDWHGFGSLKSLFETGGRCESRQSSAKFFFEAGLTFVCASRKRKVTGTVFGGRAPGGFRRRRAYGKNTGAQKHSKPPPERASTDNFPRDAQ